MKWQFWNSNKLFKQKSQRDFGETMGLPVVWLLDGYGWHTIDEINSYIYKIWLYKVSVNKFPTHTHTIVWDVNFHIVLLNFIFYVRFLEFTDVLHARAKRRALSWSDEKIIAVPHFGGILRSGIWTSFGFWVKVSFRMSAPCTMCVLSNAKWSLPLLTARGPIEHIKCNTLTPKYIINVNVKSMILTLSYLFILIRLYNSFLTHVVSIPHVIYCIFTSFVAHDDVFSWKKFSRYWSFVRGIHGSPVNSPKKGQWHGALMFSLICDRTNDWANNGDVGDLRRHRAHYDVTVMII